MGTPTVTIFGPTTPGFGFGPLAPRSEIAQMETMPCRPCHPHGPVICPLGHHKCMRNTTVATVLAEVRTVLQIVRVRARHRKQVEAVAT